MLRTKRQIRRAFLQMVGPGAFAALILMGMLAVVPLYTVPQLFSAFGDLPDIYLGPYSLALRRFSEHLLSYGVAIIGSFLFLIVLMRLSLPRLIGKIRNRLEAVQPWSSYRLYHGFRVFILLSLLLRVHPASQRLSVCLDSIETDNNAWLFWRLSITRQRLRDGSSSYAAFDQNFLRTKDAWYFSDIASAQGLEEGFAATASHLHEQLLAIFNRYSQILKWGLLIGSVGALVSLGLWHFVAINELRTGLLLFHSS
ncbi:hypothetical protein L1889_08485 [Paenalcaligenes niemegkensis]|uniref:hypothetical protein n=1 Tax=Paenalcaligenes niemegkensis TaxID=2895469 RepID=UPI001EE97019|nr:hypothetical protein [Paenalcaligenes niemegkensis]MCQ9616745.1 hypothetical protein [Paenalcaligenes niemegkensis]